MAAACSGDPEAEQVIDDLITDNDPVDEPDEPVDDPIDSDTLTIPSAPAPEIDDTPLPIDDDFRIITLANGLTVLLRSNDSPGATLNAQLVVNAGSLQQPVGLDGSAHFLEHMMFNGTEKFPANELTASLQRLGINFGADVNAYTSYDETVYFLSASTFDPDAPGIALDVLAEWAGRATIDPAEVTAEIGVVRDELRQGRESVNGIIFTQLEELYAAGTPYEGHIVIGDPEQVEATAADNLRAFYDTWYRPDNMAVIAVGDFPLNSLEEQVVERFSDLTARGESPPPREEVVIDLDPAPVTAVITHPDNANDNLSYDIPLPVWDVGTVGGERIALIEEAVAIMLSTQLDEAFQQGELDADFAPGFNSFAINRGLRYYGTNLQGPDLGGLLEQFQSHLLRAAVTGFTADDVQRAQDQLLGALDEELAGLDSKQDWQYASELMGYFLEGSGLDGTASRVARQRAVVESFDVEELTDFWRWLVGASGPVVVSIGSEAADVPSADELEAIIEEARPAEVGGAAQAIDELIATPDAAEITDESTRRTPEGDVTTWTFANGVQVSHQQSDIQAGQFFVAMESNGGWSTLDEPDASIAQAAVSAVIQSGVGDHDAATVARYLESRDLGLEFALEETAETLFGASATSDAEDLFALIHVTMTQPRVDDVALRSVGRQAETALEFLESNPVVQAETVLLELLVDGDDRYDTFLRAGDIDALDGDELLGVFATRFGTVDDLVVAIVGDIPALAARDLAARYLGTLPVGEADSWVDLGIDAPTEARRANVELTDGTANGGITRFDVVLADPTARDTVNTELLSTIITNRITDVIREELGASYGGVAAVVVDRSGAGFISSYIEVDGDPARLDEIHGALDSMLAELSTAGPSADEFDRAVTLLTNDYDFIDNFLFIDTNLELLLHPGADVLLPEDRFAVLSGLSRDDVRALAATLYGDEGSVEVWKVLP